MAQIVTITNPLTGQPAQVDQLEHTAQEIDDAIARALPGGAIDITLQNKLGGVESADHPGCYYRMVGSVVEWFNPPMELGEEYRTTERYLGKPVYVKAVDCGAMPASTNKSVEHGIENISAIISCTGYFTTGNDPVSLPYARGTVTNVGSIWASKTSIVVWVDNSNYTNCNTYGIIKCTKTTD